MDERGQMIGFPIGVALVVVLVIIYFIAHNVVNATILTWYDILASTVIVVGFSIIVAVWASWVKIEIGDSE